MNDWQQEDELWHTLQNMTDPLTQKKQLLEMAKLLLERVEKASPPIDKIEPEILTDFLLYYKVIAQSSNHFLTSALPNIEEDYQGTVFEQKLIDLNTQLKNSQERVQNCEQAIKQFSQLNQTLQQEVEKLTELENTQNELKTLHTELLAQQQNLQQKQQQLNRFIAEQQNLPEFVLQTILVALNDTQAVLAQFQQAMQNHFAENEFLANSLTQSQLKDDPALFDRIKQLNTIYQTTQTSLKQFDEILAQFL